MTVSVTTVGGTGTSVGTFDLVAAPTVTGLAPTSGPESGGTSVVITGTGFTGATAVKFGATNASEFHRQLRHPDHCDLAGRRRRGRQSASRRRAARARQLATFTYVAAPTVTGLAPTSGPATGGTSVVITGTGFTGATAVQFGSTDAATFTVNSGNADHRDVAGRHRARSP